MIQPTEEMPGRYGHPMWKRNMMIGLALCVAGIVMICSVVAAIYGMVVLAIGVAWSLAAALVGASQERADLKRGTFHDPLAGA